MKFDHTPKPRPNEPGDREVRNVRKFLLWPVRVGNETRWLERATLVVRYVKFGEHCYDDSPVPRWDVIGFAD